MHQVEGEFGGEVGPAGAGFAGSGVDGDADLAGEAGGGVALEGDHVCGRGIIEKVRMKSREGGVGEENDGEFAGGGAREAGGGRPEAGGRRAAPKDRGGSTGWGEVGGGPVEEGEEADDGGARKAQAGVAIGESDGARGMRPRRANRIGRAPHRDQRESPPVWRLPPSAGAGRTVPDGSVVA